MLSNYRQENYLFMDIFSKVSGEKEELKRYVVGERRRILISEVFQFIQLKRYVVGERREESGRVA